jgi:Icc-related predicted phosphoesterase
MELTAYTSDLHGNADYVTALNTVMNYVSEVYDSDNALVVGGDFVGESKDLQNQQAAIMNQYKESSQINAALGSFKGKVYGVAGNWDSPIIKEMLTNVQFIEYTPTDIHGKIHYGVTHSSANFFNPTEPRNIETSDKEYKSLEEHFEDVKKEISGIDVLVSHEGPHKNFCHSNNQIGQGPQLHKGLEKLVSETGTSFFCGHVHSSLYEDFESGAYGMRACAENQNGSVFLRLQNNGKEVIYEIGNKDLLNWAKQIDPSANFKLGDQKKHEQMEEQMRMQQAFQQYVTENHPDFIEIDRDFKQRLQSVQQEFHQEAELGKYPKTKDAFVDYVENKHKDLLDLEKNYQERLNEVVQEFESNAPEELLKAA